MKDYDEILVALRRITRAIDLHSKSLQMAPDALGQSGLYQPYYQLTLYSYF